MLKIAKSLITIAAVAAIAVGATGAYFTDQETVAGNTFSTGKLDIDIRGACSTTQTFSNMAPGQWTTPCEYQIYNQNTPVSTLAAKYNFYAAMSSETEAGLFDSIGVKVRHTFAGTPNPEGWPVVWQGKLGDMYVDSVTRGISDYIAPNITHVYYMQFRLDPEAGNNFQGQSAVFDLIFNATQSDNPGWSE